MHHLGTHAVPANPPPYTRPGKTLGEVNLKKLRILVPAWERRPARRVRTGLHGVAVNGHPVAQMKPFTRFGEPLTPGATGRVPAGCYFAATPHKDGFDSRYAHIGFVCRDRLVGTGQAIL